MRVNKTVSTVLATAFAGSVALGGFTAATAYAADVPRPQVAQEAPQPKIQQLQQQARMLGETADVLEPVSALLQEVLNSPEGAMPQAVAERHTKAIEEALVPLIQENRQAAPQGIVQAAPQSAAQTSVNQTAQAAPAATPAEAAVELQNQVDALISAARADERRMALAEVEDTIAASRNLLRVVAEGQQTSADTQGVMLPASQMAPGDAEKELLPY